MGEGKLYYTLLKSEKGQKAPFGRSVSTNFVALLLTLLLELIDTLDNLVYINVYIRVATMLCAYYPQLYTFSKCSKRFYILFLILSIYVFFILMFKYFFTCCRGFYGPFPKPELDILCYNILPHSWHISSICLHPRRYSCHSDGLAQDHTLYGISPKPTIKSMT